MRKQIEIHFASGVPESNRIYRHSNIPRHVARLGGVKKEDNICVQHLQRVA